MCESVILFIMTDSHIKNNEGLFLYSGEEDLDIDSMLPEDESNEQNAKLSSLISIDGKTFRGNFIQYKIVEDFKKGKKILKVIMQLEDNY